ncbi:MULTISPECIES: acetate CoA-transferase subunit alpha [Fusobacterium]|jgi:acetate CoA/acetoacetate CoA-transferase alpha subunit|uniref:Acetate CoA-transferase subunit alpha n=1 Tax=Fusobacterium varium ATCC 27725 TaxID=469618 RepID=A0ABM6U4B7_FUSVA|nr:MULTISPECIES: acetate CoA-transferase subunit alpha [Fusobacterium]AVQ31151.1 acetate CoA-transferase subunit alpha [Fusobacterium varium ATCC 27725]EES62465.1 butyrate--acetoacetate CoA-transferase subunit A [Fusobacterium varium ATCC 27725]MCF0171293.1 acetate CoA-transferase subunit alpha [Fusobacterium varium]MCF2673258.1 acetate CoA-transferase subunit alpha [Fusobacterium varium]MCI6031511.1 acetate CoA-transferase subunit alpha [Fusobacterium varium]
MKNKLVSMEEAVSHVKDGMTVFIGGFLGVGTPEKIIDALIAKGVKDLTVIANDTGFPDKGIGRLVVNNQVKKVIASHIGTNPETGRKMQSGEMEVELAPQGTLAERVRAGGNGLGGILTPTGIGTIVEEGKEVLTVDGKKYILEKPLRADVALLNGSVVDELGNVIYAKTTKNFNPMMATAADTVIVFAEKLVKVGEIDPDHVMTSRIFVDYIVK